MKINHTQHLAVNTKDIEESIKFYEDILGFTLEKKVDMGDATLVYMKVSGDCYMELFDHRGACTQGDPKENDAGLRHIAFDVDDLHEWAAFVKSKNVPVLIDVVEMPNLGKRGMLIEDPNGVVVELCCDL